MVSLIFYYSKYYALSCGFEEHRASRRIGLAPRGPSRSCGPWDPAGPHDTGMVVRLARVPVTYSPGKRMCYEELGDSRMERTFLSLDSSFDVFPSIIPPGSTVRVP